MGAGSELFWGERRYKSARVTQRRGVTCLSSICSLGLGVKMGCRFLNSGTVGFQVVGLDHFRVGFINRKLTRILVVQRFGNWVG